MLSLPALSQDEGSKHGSFSFVTLPFGKLRVNWAQGDLALLNGLSIVEGPGGEVMKEAISAYQFLYLEVYHQVNEGEN